ncbi:hypothetical protein Hanom_Chr14g01247401 [Helianthus anomalus]
MCHHFEKRRSERSRNGAARVIVDRWSSGGGTGRVRVGRWSSGGGTRRVRVGRWSSGGGTGRVRAVYLVVRWSLICDRFLVGKLRG